MQPWPRAGTLSAGEVFNRKRCGAAMGPWRAVPSWGGVLEAFLVRLGLGALGLAGACSQRSH
jgi:hypothetical protein